MRNEKSSRRERSRAERTVFGGCLPSFYG